MKQMFQKLGRRWFGAVFGSFPESLESCDQRQRVLDPYRSCDSDFLEREQHGLIGEMEHKGCVIPIDWSREPSECRHPAPQVRQTTDEGVGRCETGRSH